MPGLKIDQDIKPLSEVRTKIANFIKQVHDTKRPVIITQHGKGVAVLLDAHEYEKMRERLELLTDIHLSLNQLEKGEGIDHEEAKGAFSDLKTESRRGGKKERQERGNSRQRK
jgi:antitoxin YefM